MGCPSSRFLYLNFKERALGCWSSRFLCAMSSSSNGLFGLWTWSVVNGKNVSIFHDLHLECLMRVGFSVLCMLLWVSIQYLFSCIWFIFGFLSLLSLSFFFFLFLNNHVSYIPVFCSNMSSYPVTLSCFLYYLLLLLFFDKHISYIPMFCSNINS